MKHILRPRSFVNLVTSGLFIVSLPLIVGLFTTKNHLDKLVARSVYLVEQSIYVTRNVQELSEYTKNQERNIRLYDIVGESRYIEEARTWHDHIDTLFARLQELPADQTFHDALIEFQAREGKILTSLQLDHRGPEDQEKQIAKALTIFSNLDLRARELQLATNAYMNNELTGLKDSKQAAQRTLIWQTLCFIIMTILMIIALAFIISQPIRQLEKEIDRLGKGDFSTPIIITGPRDLEDLGKKINWLRQQLSALEKEKTKFIAHISHDLKTPLASIMEGAGLLQEELVGPLNKQQQAVAEILTKNSIKLQELIENILNFNMVQAGGKAKGFTTLALKPLIQKVISEQTPQMLAKNIHLDLHLHDATILGNREQIETIFDNLFSNAIKFSQTGGVVCCNLGQTSRDVKCIVSNTGSSIPPEEKEKIFTPFYQVTDDEHSHTVGSGLGLAIVKEYVGQHNGTISVRSQPSGSSGAHFMVSFPLLSNTQSEQRSA